MIKTLKKLWSLVFKKRTIFLHYGSPQWISLEDARPDMTKASKEQEKANG